ncbi:MAG: HD domain-containing protein [Deltaproteobacteria bacterium]|nr:HD domain-containing protein [Deltaproteobacteria bacterium]
MAGKIFITDVKDHDRVVGNFLVQQKHVPLNKNGKPYVAMVLMDQTGTMDARVWDNAEQIAAVFDSGDFVEIHGVAVSYQGRLQLKVDNVKKLSAETVNLEEFLPVSPRDRGEMLSKLQALLESISDKSLRALVVDRLQDDSFREKFASAPAAKTIHHAYLGGLLEHTLNVVELADRVAALYGELDRDLLLAGGFLHDIGKIRELGCERSFEYTDAGRLLGHIVIGAMMLTDWAQAYPELSEDSLMKLTHMILSHHGSYEFGSPKRPKFTEAMVLNYLDELDSKVQTFKEIAQRDQGNRWSSFQRLFDRYLFLGQPPDSGSPATDKTGPDKKTKKQRPDKPLTHRAFAEQLDESPDEIDKPKEGEDKKQVKPVNQNLFSKQENK